MTDQANPAPAWEPTEEQMDRYCEACHAFGWQDDGGTRASSTAEVKAARAAVFGPEIEALKAENDALRKTNIELGAHFIVNAPWQARAEKAEADRAELLRVAKRCERRFTSPDGEPEEYLHDLIPDLCDTIAKVEGRQ